MLQRCGRIDTVNTIIFQIKVRKKKKTMLARSLIKITARLSLCD